MTSPRLFGLLSCISIAATLATGCGSVCTDDGLGQDLEACDPDPSGDTDGETEVSTSEDPSGSTDAMTTQGPDPSSSDSDSGAGLMKWCKDDDGDGFGDPEECVDAEDPPGDGYAPNGDDCDDGNEHAFPGAAPNDDPEACMLDVDGDDYGDTEPGPGVEPGSDCDDSDSFTHPGAAFLEGEDACMTDADEDGWGDADPEPGVEPGNDCDDSNQYVFPGAAPLDDPDACMKDEDDDDWGDDMPPDGVMPGTDCNDLDSNTHPGAAQLEGEDACMTDADDDGYGDADPEPGATPGTDCNDDEPYAFPGAAPNDDPDACMKDEDGDDWGDDMPPDGVAPGTDCDDLSPFTYVGAAEIEAPDQCMEDEDDDGWGDMMPDGPNTTPGTDCDDQNPFAFPGAAELDDPVACMEDEDDDGYGDAAPPDGVLPGTDCDDSDQEVQVDCEPCEPNEKMCVDAELWTCNENGSAYFKEPCDHGCDPVNLECYEELIATHEPPSICIDLGSSVELDPKVTGGDGNYMYQWTPADTLDNAMIENPLASPTEPTTYDLTVTDGVMNQDQTSVTVLIQNQPLELNPDVCEIYDWPGANVGPPSAWVWNDQEKELCETENSTSTALFCGWTLDNATVEGRVQVKTGGDDDMLGMLWGIQDKAHFYIAFWKQFPQNFCGMTIPAGITVKRISADAPEDITCQDLHNPVDTANSVVLATPDEFYNVGWLDFTEYIWEITHLSDQFTIRVKTALDIVVAETTIMDSTYPSGQVGMYAASQNQTCFKGFETSCL